MVACFTILTACQLDPKNIGTPDSDGMMTTTADPLDSTTADPPEGITEGVTDGMTDGVTEPSPTTGDSDGGETSADEGSASDTDTDGQLPAACDDTDPAVSAAFTVTLPGWPMDPMVIGFLHDVPCTVDAVDTVGGTVTSALTCEVEGAPHPATLDIAAAPEGDVAWAAGDSVRLIVEEYPWDSFLMLRVVELRAAADDALLVSANDSALDWKIYDRFEPLVVEMAHACGKPAPEVPVRLGFTPAKGPTLALFSGQRGLLPLTMQEGFAIDVAEATSHEYHTEAIMKILLRRVVTGG